MKRNVVTLLVLFIMTSIGTMNASGKYPTDNVKTKDGKELTFTFFAHASFLITTEGKQIYIDPVGSYADYTTLPQADIILITHQHGDHLDAEAVNAIQGTQTQIYTTQTVADEIGKGIVMKHGDTQPLTTTITAEAIAAYNTTEGRDQFHPKGRDNGYILTIGGSRIYISGDSEPTPEMLAQKDIDILFLSVNQPYTMTEKQASEVANTLKPRICYPINYGEVEDKTDLDKLKSLITSGADVRIFPME